MWEKPSLKQVFFYSILFLGLNQVFAAWSGNYSDASKPSVVNGYYTIYNENQLAWVSDFTDGKSSNIKVKLMADLDMGGHPFIPLCAGNGTPKFSGVFDGNNHTIKNLYINSDSLSKINSTYAQNVGFIATLSGTLKNIFFENAQIEASQDYGKIINNTASPISVGVAVGWMPGGKIDDVQVSGTISTSGKGQGVGSVVGYTEEYSGSKPSISNCYSEVNIQTSGANVYVGGISGYSKGKVTISSVAFNGSVENTGTKNASAGIVGAVAGGTLTLTDCYYDSEAVSSGVAKGSSSGSSIGSDDLNSADVVCALNGGTWDASSSQCSDETSEIWSVGLSDISFNGSDGFWITFSANGGNFASSAKTSKIVAKNADITADEIGVPTLEGYFFAGWALAADASEAGDLGMATMKKTVYAVWDAGYKVTFRSVLGTFADGSSTKSVQVAKGGIVATDSVPVTYVDANGEKYYFAGWSDKEKDAYDAGAILTSEDTLHLASISLVSDTILYAIWSKAETYTVTFNANGHGYTDVQFVVVSKGDVVSEPELIANTGYEVEGWFETQDGSGEAYAFGHTISKNMTLYAKWTVIDYSIVYELDGGINGSNPAVYTVESDNIVLENPTKDGYDFCGWYYDKAFSNRATQISTGTTGDLILYAQWDKSTYVVKYIAGNNALGTLANDTKTYGEPLSLQGAGSFVRDGYKQDGWSVEYGGEKVYDLGALYEKNESVTLFPHWVKIYNITYELNGGINAEANPITYTVVDEITLVEPTRDDYTFMGWFDNADLKGSAISKISLGSSGDTTFYAKWANSSDTYGAVTVYKYDGYTEAIIDGTYSGSGATVIESDVTVDAVTFVRDFGVGARSTIMLPFTVAVSKISGGVFYEVAQIHKDDAGKWGVYIRKVDTLLANRPYIVEVAAGGSLSFDLKGEPVTLNTSIMNPSTADGDGIEWEFRGTYSKIVFGDSAETILGRAYGFVATAVEGFSVGQFAKAGPKAWIRPMRGYLVYSKKSEGSLNKAGSFSGANALEEMPEEIEVQIMDHQGNVQQTGTLNTVTGEIRMNRWFDLKGRELNSKPTTKGSYFYNGKRVIIR